MAKNYKNKRGRAHSAGKSTTQEKFSFSNATHAKINRSIFQINNTLITTLNAGDIVPLDFMEVIPGDTMHWDIKHVAKLLTPIAPTMDNMQVDIYAFFVPHRIVWPAWEELMGENKDGAWVQSSTPAPVPHYDATDNNGVVASKKLGDYYGLPPGLDCTKTEVSAIPFRGYVKIYNEWFRNQNVEAPVLENEGDLADAATYTNYNDDLFKAMRPYDLFSGCLPAPQKGESTLIPIELNTLIPVITSTAHGISSAFAQQWYQAGTTSIENTTGALGIISGSGNTGRDAAIPISPASQFVNPANLYADGTSLGQIGTSTINELRTAFQIQKLLERDARGGTRYIEHLKAHFGVNAGDYRLQNPELLGHSRSYMGIYQVPQTSESNTTEQGNLAAYGHSQGIDSLFTKSFVEHGLIHVLAVVRNKKTYQQGVEKYWSKQVKYDHYFPVLAHISEQPVYKRELMAVASDGKCGEVFGYQEAWYDHRFKQNRVSGQMRDIAANNFNEWHYADYYNPTDPTPSLSLDWMKDNSEINISGTLALNSLTYDQIKLNVQFIRKCTRPMPVNSIPGYVDHF